MALDQNLVLTIILIVSTVGILKFTKYFLEKIGTNKKVGEKRVYYISKIAQIFIVLIALFLLTFIWSVNLSGIFIFASSIFTIIGVAMFAQWSILSNITSSIIIFFSFPARVGERIKIVDGENSVIGEIVEISLFNIEIIDSQGNRIHYPNNLFIQKPVKKLVNEEINKKQNNGRYFERKKKIIS